jgi:hypothetical protein
MITMVHQRTDWLRNACIAIALMLSLLSISVSPAFAETAGQRSTRNIILAGLAITAIVLYKNYLDKKAYANSVVGYTPDGGVVYGDGRIVYPNGVTAYTSNNGNQPCTYDGYGQRCLPNRTYAYFPRGYQPPPGWYKHHKHHGDDDNNGDDHGNNGHGNNDDHGNHGDHGGG